MFGSKIRYMLFFHLAVSLISEESVEFYKIIHVCVENYGCFSTIRCVQSKRQSKRWDYANLGFFHEMIICPSARSFVSLVDKSNFIRFGELLLWVFWRSVLHAVYVRFDGKSINKLSHVLCPAVPDVHWVRRKQLNDLNLTWLFVYPVYLKKLKETIII